MSRPKGSKNKAKTVVAAPDIGVLKGKQAKGKDALAIKGMLDANPKISGMVEKSLAMGYVPILKTVDFPSNWNEMGKIQKLEWLTANPRK